MKRMHIHLGVEDLNQSIQFYSALFGTEPSRQEGDYAKWLLDDPRVNFAISTRVGAGVDHLGVQVESDDELDQLRAQLKQADMTLFDEGETVCCYARSEKSWVTDPQGVAWETYKTMGDAEYFHGTQENLAPEAAACCASGACC